jgi:hypothetical protein
VVTSERDETDAQCRELPAERADEVTPISNSKRAIRVLRNIARDWIASCAGMARPRSVTENIMTAMFVIARIGIRAADSATVASGMG